MVNFPVLLLAALVPMVLGMIWYNQKVFGNANARASNIPDDGKARGHKPMVYIVSYIFCFFLAFGIQFLVIHQMHYFSILANEPGIRDEGSPVRVMIKEFMEKYGTNFRTFKHGVFHGTLSGIMLALPLVGLIALFEGRGFKYIAINVGYWIVSMALMGGIICQFA